MAKNDPHPRALRIETLDSAPPVAIAKAHVVKGVVALGESVVIAGPPKSGKSALVTDLLASVALGEDWRGYRSRRRVAGLYVALERGTDVTRMLRAQAARRGTDCLPVAVARGLVNLLDPDSVAILTDTVRAAREALGVEVGIVVVDTIAKAIAAGGGDEDKARDMGRALAHLGRLRDETGVATICIAHTSKSEEGGPRGSGALIGDADLVVQIKVRGETRIAEVTHANDRPTGHLTTFTIEEAVIGVDEDGEAVTTRMVSGFDENGVTAPDPRDNLSPDQRLILDAITASEAVTDVTEGDGNAPWRDSVTKALRGRSPGAIRKAISAGLKTLVAKGLIERRGGCYRVTKSKTVTPGNDGNGKRESVTARPRILDTGGDGNASLPEPKTKPQEKPIKRRPRHAPSGARAAGGTLS